MQITRPSANFVKLCHDSESCRLKAYKDVKGVWTIGWGHTGKDVYEGKVITQPEADNIFINDVVDRYKWLNNQHFNLNQNQYDAVLDLIYNIGFGNFQNDTILYNTLKSNPSNFKIIEARFNEHIYSEGKVYPGLVTRRHNDFKLYSTL